MTPVPAASVILVRDSPTDLEVLMVARPSSGTFPGLTVFPGGRVDGIDALVRASIRNLPNDDHRPFVAAALRELAEEVGVFLTETPLPEPPLGYRGLRLHQAVLDQGGRFEAARLRYVSNWITPPGAPYRFDTRFYLATVDLTTSVKVAGEELLEAFWVSPKAALEQAGIGKRAMIIPTLAHLELLAAHADVAGLLKSVDRLPRLPPMRPRSAQDLAMVKVLVEAL